MIREILTNSNPMFLTGGSTSVVATCIDVPKDSAEVEFCTCDCDFTEYALWDAGTEEHKNDSTSVLVRRIAGTETFAFKIVKGSAVVATITNDTYGKYWAFGSLTYGYYSGTRIDWKLVAQAFGNGDYKILVERTFGGNTTQAYSHVYLVRPYSPSIAKGTVKIETIQNGNYVLSETFRAMEWYQSIRLDGKLWNKQPKIETTEYVDSGRLRNQVWDKITNTYQLEVRAVPSFIGNELVYGRMMANTIYLTDYNINYEQYRKVPMRIENIAGAKAWARSGRMAFRFELTDLSEGTIKGY